VAPIYQSVTFELDDVAYRDIIENEGLDETWYSRFGNPTVEETAASIGMCEMAAA
jgi:O-acetylhomoserine/O-acetylserine sulfhydrylase-like pyridoxal-dependent enzyme